MTVGDYSTSVYRGVWMITLPFRLVVTTTADELIHAMAHAVGSPTVTARSRVQSQASRCGICRGQSTVETRFPCLYRSTDALCVSVNK
jgi:hypothetical protein